MIHNMFGGNRNGDGRGWATLSKVSLLTGAANFHGGLPVLKHSVVKIAEFLRGRATACYPGGKCDSREGKGDGSRLYYVNPWTMKWSQII